MTNKPEKKEGRLKRLAVRMQGFVKTAILGGVTVILPAAISLFILKWIFDKVTAMIQGPTNWIMTHVPAIGSRELMADTLVILVILFSCFLIGLLVKTHSGTFLFRAMERYVAKVLPAYGTIREIVQQFMGNKESPFSSVALVRIFENDTLMTAFVTERHDNGMCTVFVPTGPNPTSGNIYHLKEEFVHHLDAGVEETMKSIIGCGAGSTGLVKAYTEGK